MFNVYIIHQYESSQSTIVLSNNDNNKKKNQFYLYSSQYEGKRGSQFDSVLEELQAILIFLEGQRPGYQFEGVMELTNRGGGADYLFKEVIGQIHCMRK